VGGICSILLLSNFGDVPVATTVTSGRSMDKPMSQLDSAGQKGPEITLEGVLIVVKGWFTAGRNRHPIRMQYSIRMRHPIIMRHLIRMRHLIDIHTGFGSLGIKWSQIRVLLMASHQDATSH